ncbi:phosphate ABC transporter substrate-binding protein PstS family protein [Lactococcus nasutitermitis]|uniref:Phosphate-binding protein n=1 Tax=Lactococcus nasutitermitis TaxID=1652957 RepID=A0ABV9JC66_9LACT|nr:phosphate ABC transporter substrate-binding protein PstS family protein [Lactococcus nasutitermitis]
MKKKILIALMAASSLFALTACGTGGKQVTAGGSTALQPLVEQSSMDYMKQHSKEIIMVQGGGSGVGLAQVAAGSFQIGNSDIFAEEKPGINSKKITDHKVAVIGFAPIINKKLKVSNLTNQQLVDIFTGKITNWSQVDGPNQKITVIGRTAGSGTRVNFDKYALNNATEVNGPTQDASGSVVQLVGQTPGAISYVAFSYIHKPGVKPLEVNSVAPTDENVVINKWKIWSYEHMYTNNAQVNKTETSFINYVKNDKATLKKLGYIPVSAMKVDRDAKGNVSKIK